MEQFIGVPIQYYAQMDFNTFVEFIDLIGGIEIHNSENLRLDPVGTGKDKISTTCCGMRHMNGESDLAYARYRKGDEGDVGRAKRQQKVILAIRIRCLALKTSRCSWARPSSSMRSFRPASRTNMPFDTAIQLGVLARDIPVESIKQGVIDYSMVALDNVSWAERMPAS